MHRSCHLLASPRAAIAALAVAWPLAAWPGSGAAQEQPAIPQLRGSTTEENILKARASELERARAEQQRAAEAEKKLRLEIEALGADRRKLSAALIETAAKIRDAENRLSTMEGRIEPLETRERDLRQSLANRRDEIAEVLAALQRAGRRPPPAILVSPEDAVKSVRSAIVLGAILPEMRDRAEQLAGELSELARLRTNIANERKRLTAEVAAMAAERQRMAALVDERQKSQAEAEKSLVQERQTAIDMARQIDNLKDLVARLEQGVESANRAARAAEKATEDQKGESRPDFVALKDPGRLTPAIAFASARGMLPMPVNGVKIRNFGATDRFGSTERGISIATRAGAQVTSPGDGWVVYAGPFRSYGQLLILNAGGGYHIVLAGMERISVDIGQFVLTGEPVAVMGSGAAQVAAAVPVGTSQPVLYVEFRKDGTPVDPGPWWAKSESEKVRG
ncbi:MAG: peptidoglycan DD-metalloendopeptidase family protein [Pseudorhodoplanes sp.]|jgi:septal ring factor EnvC (AmiA/AmiB activator)|nr:peptidoglycan DD-metalloendopeptidase family protein [Pseudorhodoplanes sp.]